MRLNKKGFTLVELLAVIVILAVVMLIAVTSVGPMMEKSRKSSLGTEGLAMLDAAQTAFQAEGLKGAAADYTSTSSVCYTLQYLCLMGYFEKGCSGADSLGDKYTGSVLANYNSGSVKYSFWLSNGTYKFGNSDGVTEATYGNIENTTVVTDGTSALTDCNNLSGVTITSKYNCSCTPATSTVEANKSTCKCTAVTS